MMDEADLVFSVYYVLFVAAMVVAITLEIVLLIAKKRQWQFTLASVLLLVYMGVIYSMTALISVRWFHIGMFIAIFLMVCLHIVDILSCMCRRQ